MYMESTELHFHEISSAPARPGVYAWYHRLFIPTADIDFCISALSQVQGDKKAEIVRDFLTRHVFDHYKEDPYEVRLKGKLKPTYRGHVEHTLPVSPSLVKRLAEEPGRLRTLSNVLRSSMPVFASPIYIGVAAVLRRRLQTHKRLIEQYAEAHARGVESFERPESFEDEEERSDHSFAIEVCRARRFSPNNLCVWVAECPVDPSVRIDVENVLNRINYPLCGRN